MTSSIIKRYTRNTVTRDVHEVPGSLFVSKQDIYSVIIYYVLPVPIYMYYKTLAIFETKSINCAAIFAKQIEFRVL